MKEQVQIKRAVYGGDGLARLTSGAVTFVPFTLPGEVVELAATEGKYEAELLTVLQASPDRVSAPCPHFGRCGGCQYQHASYAAQLAMKCGILLETMERAGVGELPELAVHAGGQWEYRNRSRMRIARVEGELRVGYNVRGTNEFLPIVTCPISAPLVVRAAEALLTVARADRDAAAWLDAVSEVEFFTNDDCSRLGMTLFMRGRGNLRKGSFARMCEELQKQLPELSGAGTLPSTNTARTVKDQAESWGANGLVYRADGETYWISRGGFFQVNRFLTDKLIELVCAGRSGAVAWDLYAGVGLFSRVLARSFVQTTAVEANPTAIADLHAAFARTHAEHRAVQASTVAFLRDAVVQRERPELIVLDPPRAGAGAEACELLLKMAAHEMVYVSCDPTTLARDLAVLQQEYRVGELHLVDLFPQTFHMETVVVLERR